MIKYTATKKSQSAMPDGELKLGYVAISHHWVADKKQRRLLTGRWVKIRCGKETIYRVLRFSPQVSCDKNNKSGGIVIDYDGWLELSGYSEDSAQTLAVEIFPSRLGAATLGAIRHPDPTHRLACQLAYISLFLGVLSIAQSTWPLIRGWFFT